MKIVLPRTLFSGAHASAIATVSAFIMLTSFIGAPAALADQRSDDLLSQYSTIDHLNELTKHLVAKELELQKLNAHFRLASTRQPRWRPWRQFAYSETNAGCTETGMIARMALSYPFMKTPATIYKLSTVTTESGAKERKVTTIKTSLAKAARPSAQLVEHAATTQMIGQIIGAAGDVFELSSNVVGSMRSRRDALDAKAYGKNVKAASKELDELLLQREKILHGSSEISLQQLSIARTEGAILHDVRDLSLLQYAQYRSGARNLKTFQNAAYVLNIAKNAAGAAGNVVNLESTHLSQPKLAGSASLLTLVAGGVIVVTPLLGRVSGNLAGLVDRRIASKGFVNVQTREAGQFVKHRQELSELLSQTGTAAGHDVAARIGIYDQEERLLLAQRDNLQRENKLGKNTTIENVVFGTVVGSSRISQGALGMVGAWHYFNQSWMNSRLVAAGATAYGAGTAFNILETARVRAEAQVSFERLKKQHLLPSQVVQDRINTLDAMQRSLDVIAAKPGQSCD